MLAVTVTSPAVPVDSAKMSSAAPAAVATASLAVTVTPPEPTVVARMASL